MVQSWNLSSLVEFINDIIRLPLIDSRRKRTPYNGVDETILYVVARILYNARKKMGTVFSITVHRACVSLKRNYSWLEGKKVSCIASVRLCAGTHPVHRPRMELFVGYSRRVEDEWFWREKRESFSALPAMRDHGIFNGATWCLFWLNLYLRQSLGWILPDAF